MLQKHISTVCWGIGLTEGQQSALQEHLGAEQSFVFWPLESLPGARELESANPCVLWLSVEANRLLSVAEKDATRHLSLLPRVLLLDEGYSLADFESACDSGISDVLRPPFSRKKFTEVLHRALETKHIHNDMICMSREIMLERELLERKNELLSFLVNFLTNTSESLDLESILSNAFKGLKILFPARSMHVALWHQEKDEAAVTLHICAGTETAVMRSWQEELLEQTSLILGKNYRVTGIHSLCLPHQEPGWAESGPGSGSVICLPFAVGQETLGVLLLLVEIERNLGRDQVLALDSAMRHLALNIKNSRRFHAMQMHVDYDALTKVHSRRHFEERLDEEVSKAIRYEQPLSMIMLDIDYFKEVNDTRGHHVGDAVLREVAAVVSGTIRNIDYCARYGGEEFAILLPHTDGQKSFILAERLRKRVARHTFFVEGGPLKLSISMGVAPLPAGGEFPRQELVCLADAALYEAKAGGRNRTCVSKNCECETGLRISDIRQERSATV